MVTTTKSSIFEKLEGAFSRVSAEEFAHHRVRVVPPHAVAPQRGGKKQSGIRFRASVASACARQPTRQAPSSSTHLLEEVARRKHGKICQVSNGYSVRSDRPSGARCGSGSRHDHGTGD